MLRAAILLIGLLILAIPAFAQADKSLQCPMVSITGPAGIVQPGSITTYVLNIENPERYRFVWTVLEGETIVSGQGTTRLDVRRGRGSGEMTATVEVTGLPTGCPYVFSETTPICILPAPNLIKELSISLSRIDRVAIDSFIDLLLSNPNAQGYIVLEFAAGTSPKTVSNYQKKIEVYIASHANRIESDRFTFVHSNEADANRLKLYLVPPGATPPTR
jgi:hypothetical protein